MKIKDLYNPIINGSLRRGFIRAVDDVKSFNSLWYEELDENARVALDNYILLKIGNKSVMEIYETLDIAERYKFFSDILLTYNYQLDGLFRLLIPNDSSEQGYNPLDNVFEVRHETTERDFDKGEQVDRVNMDDRHTETLTPSYSDVTTNNGKKSPFDSSDYDKADNQTKSTTDYGAHTIETDTDSTNDSTTSGTRHDDERTEYDVKRHGNIGVTTSFELISGDRRVHYYNFFNEVVNVLIHELTNMLW